MCTARDDLSDSQGIGVKNEQIDAVITTSPPGSVHFVGAAVKRATGALWLADLRDPLIANPHRRADTAALKA